jgi:hypothetical protein
MPVQEERAFTQCGVDFHLKKPFVIGLGKPSADRLDDLRTRYDLAKFTYDGDKDLLGRDGKLQTQQGVARLREIGLLSSSDRAAAICLGGTTSDAILALEDIIQTAFGVEAASLRNAINYVSYDTATKVQFGGPLYALFAPPVRTLFEQWGNIDSKAVIATFEPTRWPPDSSAMVHTTEDYWEKYFGEGAPKNGFVVPSDLHFHVYVPTRFFKMTKYELQLAVESTEDFLEHKYFVKSEMPHFAHMQLLNQLDGMITAAP